MAVRIQLRRGTAASWAAANPILAAGEVGFETDTLKFKVGNGVTAWADLGYTASEIDMVDAAAAVAAQGLAEDARDAAQASASAAAVSESAAAVQAGDAADSAADALSSANAAAAEAAEAAGYADDALAAYEGRITGGSVLLSTPNRLAEAERLLKSAVWWIDAKEPSADGQVVPNLGWGGSALNAQAGSSGSADSNDPKHLAWTGENYVYLPGVASNYLSVPDEAALDFSTGTVRYEFKVALDDWTPATIPRFMGRYGSSAGNYFTLFDMTSAGILRFLTSPDGTTVYQSSSTVAVSAADGEVKWVAVERVLDNGAGGHDTKFYTSDDGVAWTQLGATVTVAGATTIGASTRVLEIGSSNNGAANTLAGKVYRAIIKSNDVTVLDVDCTQITSGSATSFQARTGQTVTINRSTSGRKAVAVTQPCWLFGTDDYMEVADNDLLDFGASDSFSVLAVAREWNSMSGARPLIDKSTILASGYALLGHYNGVLAAGAVVHDGTTSAVPSGALSAGSLTVIAGTLDRASALLSVAANGSVLGQVSTSAIGSLANSVPLCVGKRSDAVYVDFEGVAFAVFRKALTQYEIELLNDYYQARDAGLDVQQPKKYVNEAALPVGAKGDLAFNEQSQQLLVKQGDNWNGVLTEGSVLRAVPAAPSPAESLLKQAVWWIDANHSSASGQKVRNLGWGGSALDATAGSSGAADSNDPKFLDFDGTPYVYLPGVTNNYLALGDSDELDVTGDFELRLEVKFESHSTLAIPFYKSSAYEMRLNADGTVNFRWFTAGAQNSRNSTAPVPFAAGTRFWIRVALDVDNGAAGNTVTYYTSQDGLAWTRLGTPVVTAGTTSVDATLTGITIGTGYSIYVPMALYRAQVLNGINGTPVLDVDTSVLNSGSQTSFQALTGQTVTINRSTSGRKSTCVVAPVWLLGTDDYMEVADNDLLDFGATDTFTVLMVNRQPSITTSQVMISKRATAVGTSTGWLMRNGTTGTTVGFLTSDGTTGGGAGTSASRTAGELSVIASVYPVATGSAVTYINGVAGATGSTATGSLSNSLAMRVGSLVGGGTNADMEFIAAAVFRRALTEAEIQTITDYYAGR